MCHVEKQMEMLLSFIPDEILYSSISQINKMQNFFGVVLTVDVSGFTYFCEKYNTTHDGGIYNLTATVNAYIGSLVEVIHFYGGDVLKFSGDSFLALWKASPDVCLYELIHEVIVCGFRIQHTLGMFRGEVETLNVKLAISCGNLTFSVIGVERNKSYVLVGQAIDDLEAAKSTSDWGDLTISQSTWCHVAEESYAYCSAEGGNVKIRGCIYNIQENVKKLLYSEKTGRINSLCAKHYELRNVLQSKRKFNENISDIKLIENFIQLLPPRAVLKTSLKRWITSELNPFVLRPLRKEIEGKQSDEMLMEMRELTIQFINIVPASRKHESLVSMIKSAYKSVYRLVEQTSFIHQVSVSEGNINILVVFGLQGFKHDQESQKALRSAHKIRKRLVSSNSDIVKVSVGIVKGIVYCGIVGHPFRKGFIMVGKIIDQAKLITRANHDMVVCDRHTYVNSKLSSMYFQLRYDQIFEYNEDIDDPPQIHHNNQISLIGREHEQEYVKHSIIRDVECHGLLIKGKAKSGKSTLLLDAVNNCVTKRYHVASVTLIGGSQRPYHCVSLLYRQLFDRCIKLTSHLPKHLKRSLWNFNEIIQKTIIPTLSIDKIDRHETILGIFIEICKCLGSTITVLFVDDVQYIDLKSFEILNETLKLRAAAKLVCAGTFEQGSWDTLWKFSLSNQMKILDLEPMEITCLPSLICKIMKVRGVPVGLCEQIAKCCEGVPGWIRDCLQHLIKIGEIKFAPVLPDRRLMRSMIYPDLECLKPSEEGQGELKGNLLPILILNDKEIKETTDLSLETIFAYIFDSFNSDEQLILKTASILNDTFTRNVLTTLLNVNTREFAKAMCRFFEEDLMDCASKYVSSGGVHSTREGCFCYINRYGLDPDEVGDGEFPKYAFCKNLHFRNKMLKRVAYETMKESQRKALHLKCCEILETKHDICRFCLHDNSPGGGQMIAVAQGTISNCSICPCLERLMNNYSDLVYHSRRAGHVARNVFFLYQNGLILSMTHQNEEAIEVLKEASQLCMSLTYQSSYDKCDIFGRICSLLAEIYFKSDNLIACRNYAMLSLRQYNKPTTAQNLNRLRTFKVDKLFSSVHLDNNSREAVVKCLWLFGRIYLDEGHKRMSEQLIRRSLSLTSVTRENLDLTILGDIYSSVMETYNYKSCVSICEELEEKLRLQFFSSEMTKLKLCYLIFNIKTKYEPVPVALRAGFRLFDLSDYAFRIEFGPILNNLLMLSKRIEEVVYIARYLQNSPTGEIAYHSICLGLIIEANFYLEPMENIEHFAERHFSKDKSTYTVLESNIIVNLIAYYLRENRVSVAALWKRKYNCNKVDLNSFYSVFNFLKYIESELILFEKDLEGNRSSREKLTLLLDRCNVYVDKWHIFLPRLLHCKGYLKMLRNKVHKAKTMLKLALSEAQRVDNVLEQSWITLSLNCWRGAYSSCRGRPLIHWQMAKCYSPLQWSQIMYPLPIS